MISCKIDNWVLKVNKISCKICVYKDGNLIKEIRSKVFEQDGLRKMPKPLYNLICKELKYANIYDKFLNKYYDWDEEE